MAGVVDVMLSHGAAVYKISAPRCQQLLTAAGDRLRLADLGGVQFVDGAVLVFGSAYVDVGDNSPAIFFKLFRWVNHAKW